MAGVIIDDARTPLERVVLEFRVIAVEAVELHDVARAALLAGNFVQIEICALVFLVAGCAIETAGDDFFHWKCDALRDG